MSRPFAFHVGLQVRRMRPEDLDEVVAIEQGCYAAPWTRNMFLQEMSNRVSRQLVFLLGHKVIGYVCFWEVMDESQVLNVAVHPDWRRRSHGKHILDVVELISRTDGLKKIVLDVGKRNIPARNLYSRCGFRVVGFRKNYYSEIQDDALVMEKSLCSDQDSTVPQIDEP